MSTYIPVGGGSIPFIIVYQGPLMTYLWGKSLAINDYYMGVTFSEDGTYIVAVTYYSPTTITIFNAITGSLID